MGVITKEDPCDRCKHEVFEQVDQHGYLHYCDKGMPEKAFYSGCGCYKFKKRKGDKHRKALD